MSSSTTYLLRLVDFTYLKVQLTLFFKVKNGAKGSNHSVEWIILESPLVQVYRNVQGLVEKNFKLTHHTTNHVPPDMKKTFTKLLKHLSLNSPHIVSMGRKSRHQIVNLHNKWGDMTQKITHGNTKQRRMIQAKVIGQSWMMSQ